MKPPFRIAVIECDDSTPQDRYSGYTGWFERLFQDAVKSLDDLQPRDLEFSGFNVVKNPDRYPTDENIDAVLLSGSKYNAFDNDAWIVKVVGYVQRLLKQDRIRIIGVCFGHQIIGRALGAKVGRCELGWEAAVTLLKMTDKGRELFKKDIMSLQQMHRDAVLEYPEGVEALCSTPICEVHGMYKKGKLITVQGHPEFDGKAMNWLLDSRHEKGMFDDDFYKSAKARADNEDDSILVAQTFLRFLLEE